jgi:predicted RNA-binding Zn ribbon-like protein
VDESRNPRLVGGHRALDLVNTVAPRGAAAERDWLATPQELLDWAQWSGVIDAREAATVRRSWSAGRDRAGEALRAVVALREAAYDVLSAALAQWSGSPGAATGADRVARALDRLRQQWATAAARTQLVCAPPADPPEPGRGRGVVALVPGSVPALLIGDRLTHAVIDLLRTVDLTSLRRCPVGDGGCGWLFLDHSRNGSRRWCSMADCGGQAKARRLTARRRDLRTAT